MDSVEVARILVAAKAVSFRTDPLFEFTSGAKSPIYVDNRRLIGLVTERTQISAALVDLLDLAVDPIHLVAGAATAGIPWAAWVAAQRKLPMVYVRAASKRWGARRSVEGYFEQGWRAVLVEDLISTGGSALNATQQLQAEGIVVDRCLAIVTYALKGSHLLGDTNVQSISLTNIEDVITAGHALGQLGQKEYGAAERWLHEARDAAARG